MGQRITLDIPRHCAILGMTQSGKTVLAREIFEAIAEAALYIDYEDLGEIQGRRMTRDTSIRELKRALSKRQRIRYVPEWGDAENDVRQLYNALTNCNENVYVFADEIQQYGDFTRNALDVFAVRGLKRGIHLVAISQRPANLSKTILTQINKYIFFRMQGAEKVSMGRYDLPREIITRTNQAPKHSFYLYERGSGLDGPYKLRRV